VKDPSWLEVNWLAVYMHGGGFELKATVKQIQEACRAELEPGTTALQV